MTARPVAGLPEEERAGGFAFEPKFDGWRCIGFRSTDGVFLQSRQQRPLGRYFPEIAAGLAAQVPPGTVLDGELVVYRGGRLDFAALQRRILWVPETRLTSCDLPIFVEEAAEPVVAADAGGRSGGVSGARVGERPVRVRGVADGG
jgi:hypothetical protein